MSINWYIYLKNLDIFYIVVFFSIYFSIYSLFWKENKIILLRRLYNRPQLFNRLRIYYKGDLSIFQFIWKTWQFRSWCIDAERR